ncbi:hypothetical protein GO001_14945 [Streptomyces sp. NRRL B-1677]|uniref:hypothetical protein n=1 Tax=Streptomyces TaxID=1883 RepID=UPI0011C47723|nr:MULTISPECIES: hypothetical protein [Streptomyces]MBF6046508.1 hypothetical protein [Streptomyces sp. NRRL B-1677]
MPRIARAFTATALLTLLTTGLAAPAHAAGADTGVRTGGTTGRTTAQPMMFDVIPRWALALGIDTISAAGVATVAMEGIGTTGPACVQTHAGVPSTACATVGDRSKLVSIDELQVGSGSPG